LWTLLASADNQEEHRAQLLSWELSDTRADFVNSLIFPSTRSLHHFVSFSLCVFLIFLWFITCPDNTEWLASFQIQCTMKENVMDIVYMFRKMIFHVLAITFNTKKDFETMKWPLVTMQCLFILFFFYKLRYNIIVKWWCSKMNLHHENHNLNYMKL